MWLMRERLSILQWNILHRVDNLTCTPKNRNHLRSHSGTIMALDHSRLGLENKSGRIFCFRQIYFTKSCQQIWGCVNQLFILFIRHIWDETVLFIIQTTDRMQYFTIFQDKLHSVNIQDDQSWAFSETVQKISKITCTASRFSLSTSAKFALNINRVTLQHNKNLLCFFVFNGFITMCNLKKRLIRAAFWVLLQAMFMNDWKQTAQRLKLQERLLTINKRNISRWNI